SVGDPSRAYRSVFTALATGGRGERYRHLRVSVARSLFVKRPCGIGHLPRSPFRLQRPRSTSRASRVPDDEVYLGAPSVAATGRLAWRPAWPGPKCCTSDCHRSADHPYRHCRDGGELWMGKDGSGVRSGPRRHSPPWTALPKARTTKGLARAAYRRSTIKCGRPCHQICTSIDRSNAEHDGCRLQPLSCELRRPASSDT